MALFKKNDTTEVREISLTPEEAFAAVTIIAMNIDGINHSMEFKVIGMAMDRMKLFQSYTTESLKQMLQKLQKVLIEQGDEPLYRTAIKNIPQDLIPTAFAVAVDIIMADGKVVEKEQELLSKLADSLKIDPNMTKKIVEVMQIRYRG